MVPPQYIPMNERTGYENKNYSASYSQYSYGAQYTNVTDVPYTNSASYANACAHNSVSYVTNNYCRINENSARHSSVNAHDLASYIPKNYSHIHEN